MPAAAHSFATKEGEGLVSYRISRADLMHQCGFGPDVMKTVKVCRVCGCACSAKERYCRECGAVLPKGTLFDLYRSQHLSCPACDTVVAKNTRFCPRCGKQLRRKSPV